MNREIDYLKIPDAYFSSADELARERFATLAWSPAGDVIEWADGTTFLYAAKVAQFLEGYLLLGPLIHFAHILHILQMFDKRLDPSSPDRSSIREDSPPTRMPDSLLFFEESEQLIHLYHQEGCKIRNLGALCSYLCREIPPVADSPDPYELKTRLSKDTLLSAVAVQRWQTSAMASNYEAPALDAEEFKDRFASAIRRLTPAEIVEWLRHGRGAADNPGERLAREIEERTPRALGDVLATLEGFEETIDSKPMIGQLTSALTLPPRRLAHRALPSGGYADVATRGRPEQILPSQFAIDDIEFLRRFAENELLYFHREEPHSPITEELVVLIDQGVRAWGLVRHALSAAAIALGKLADRRKLAFLVGGTSSEGRLLDPTFEDDGPLESLWKACDLTPNPALALDRILGDEGSRPRDVVVLSHPRNVAEPDFAAATRRASPGTRVFSVVIDLSGSVQLREWRNGNSVKLGDFRVDFHAKSNPPKARPESSAITDPRCWKGDVEPIPYPFRFGVIHRIDRPLFDFDHAGRWFLFNTYRGILNAWSVDGSASEILPRGMVAGEVMERVHAVIGVAGGFVVGGVVGKALVAVHYEFASRTAMAFVLDPDSSECGEWSYSREFHTVVARHLSTPIALDLSNREVSGVPEKGPTSRASRAFKQARWHAATHPRLLIRHQGETAERPKVHHVNLDRESGELSVWALDQSWRPFTPRSDGKPSLRQWSLDHAQLRGNVLAVVASSPDQLSAAIRLYHGPSGVPSREFGPTSEPGHFILSPDGKYLARQVGERQVEIGETSGAGRPISTTTKGKTHSDPKVTLGRYGMVVQVGKHHITMIRWDQGRVVVSDLPEDDEPSIRGLLPWPIDRAATRSARKPAVLHYDPKRFHSCARGALTVVVDFFGQIGLFDPDENLVALFVVFRGQVSAWLPDGTRYTSGQEANHRIEGPIQEDAAEVVGRRLKAASDAADPR